MPYETAKETLMYSDVHLENIKERKTIFTKATKTKYIGTNLTINA